MKHYIIIRHDLPPGDKLAQVAHASGGSALRPLAEDTYAYVLRVEDERELLEIAEKLRSSACPHVVVREPDAPYHGQATAIGCIPTQDTKRIRKVTRHLRLAS